MVSSPPNRTGPAQKGEGEPPPNSSPSPVNPKTQSGARLTTALHRWSPGAPRRAADPGFLFWLLMVCSRLRAPACYGTELRKPGSRGVVLLTPRRLLSNATDQCLQAHLPAFLAGTGISKRPFTLPKRLPVSRPPFRGRSSRPTPSTPCRLFVLPVRIPIP
jgi:hypothetical protein